MTPEAVVEAPSPPTEQPFDGKETPTSRHYYYRIYHPRELHQPGWLLTHAPLLNVVFKRLPQWRLLPKDQPKLLDYANHPRSPICNYFRSTELITSKSFLARLCKDMDFHPPTYYLQGGHLSLLNTVHLPTPNAIRKGLSVRFPRKQSASRGKWFLKPDDGHAGQGIEVFNNWEAAVQYTRQAPHRQKRYVLQRGIEHLALHEGRKFEFRLWIVLPWVNGCFYPAYYHDAVMRICAVPYQANSLDRQTNITTSALHYQHRELFKSALLSTQPFYQEVYPQALQQSRTVLERLFASLQTRQKVGFELMGFDFLVQELTQDSGDNNEAITKSYRPVLVEINRKIGYYTYPPGVHAPEVVQHNYQMITDLVPAVLEPLADEQIPHFPTGGWQLFP